MSPILRAYKKGRETHFWWRPYGMTRTHTHTHTHTLYHETVRVGYVMLGYTSHYSVVLSLYRVNSCWDENNMCLENSWISFLKWGKWPLMLNAIPETVGPADQRALWFVQQLLGLWYTVSSYKGVGNFNSLGRNLGRRER